MRKIDSTFALRHAPAPIVNVLMLKAGWIVADGFTLSTINKNNLYKLYDIHIDVLRLICKLLFSISPYT
jgi:ABC-type cobalamin/Fe3+-siderophores transport system ATPase subunit